MIRKFLEPVAEREQEKQRRAFGPGVDGERAEGDRDHEEMDVDPAAFQGVDHVLHGKPSAGQISGHEAKRDRRRARAGSLEQKSR